MRSMIVSRSGLRTGASRTAIQWTECSPIFGPPTERPGSPSAPICRLLWRGKHRFRRVEPASQHRDDKMPGLPPAAQRSRESWLPAMAVTPGRPMTLRLVSSPSAGGMSVAFRDAWHGILGGGDLSTNILPMRQRQAMAARPGRLRTSLPCRGPFSAWPMCAAVVTAMVRR